MQCELLVQIQYSGTSVNVVQFRNSRNIRRELRITERRHNIRSIERRETHVYDNRTTGFRRDLTGFQRDFDGIPTGFILYLT